MTRNRTLNGRLVISDFRDQAHIPLRVVPKLERRGGEDMGLYIDPKGRRKEEWLQEHGTIITDDFEWTAFDEDTLPVVLIENGLFTAAGVAYSEAEYDLFMEPDGRPRTVFAVSKKDIMEVTGGALKNYIVVPL